MIDTFLEIRNGEYENFIRYKCNLKGILKMLSFKNQFVVNLYIRWDKLFALSHFSGEVDPGHLIEGKSV